MIVCLLCQGHASWDTDIKMGIKNSIQDKIAKA